MKYVDRADRYAREVLAAKLPACVHIRNACKRYQKDRKRTRWPYTLDPIKGDTLDPPAERWCRFLEKLPHIKGKWARKRELLVLADWEVFFLVNVFGWRHKRTRLRRFREAYLEVPRKSGKSFKAAGIGLGMLTIDREPGAEVYCGATTEKQAWEVFRPAREILLRSPDLVSRFGIEVNAKTIAIPETGSRFEPLIGNPGDGPGPSCGIVDEFHEHKTSDLVDTLETGMGAREQPLMLYITTAGDDLGGPCYHKRADVIQVLKGSVKDESIFGLIYTLDEGDEWDTVEALKKANPNYGISVDADFLAAKLRQARRSAAKQASFKTKHLNLWVGSRAAWMNLLAFQACRKRDIRIEQWKGERCFIGLDLASRVDIASMAILFPPSASHPKWAAFFRRFVPEAVVLEGEGTRYKAWHTEGWLETTAGDVIDFSAIEDAMKDLRPDHEIVEVPYDPFQATQFSTRMREDEGFPMIEYGQTVRNFSEPMKELEKLIVNREIEFEMDPVLLWMMGNVTARLDAKDNIYPTKEFRENKIDDVVALIMALGRAMIADGGESVYETRDLLVL